jgi:two-component system alkaline phosphatase synthesis response regulator PhoP
MEKILIIEDEKDIVDGLRFNLEARGYTVIAANDGDEGLRVALADQPNLVILDLMLPKLNGYEVCRKIKEENPLLSIIMLTAKSQEAEIVHGLDLGADDYITKPFGLLELLARIKAILRRSKNEKDLHSTLAVKNLYVDFAKHRAKKKGRTIDLTPREYEILKYFVERGGEIVSREDLLNHVWGYTSYPNTRTVDTHIAKLRQKIEENPEKPQILITIHTMGYKLLV